MTPASRYAPALRNAFLLASGLLLCLLSGISPASASGIVDQHQTADNSTVWFGWNNSGARDVLCQSFKPTGSVLTGFDLKIGRLASFTGATNARFVITSGGCYGQASWTGLYTHVLGAAEGNTISNTGPAIFHHELTTPLPVTPGATYWINFASGNYSKSPADWLQARFQSTGGYPDGNLRMVNSNFNPPQVSDNTVADLWFKTYAAASGPALTGLAQFDVATPLAESATSTHDSVIFKGTVSSPGGSQVKLQAELKPVGAAFDGMGLLESAFVASGSVAQIGSGVLPDGQYHWRARAVDALGLASDWQEFGVQGNVDFGISKAIKVAVILADLADVTHADPSTLHQPCKLPSLDQNRTYSSWRDYYQDMFTCVNDYYDENSYGTVRFEFKIFDDGGGWYTLPHAQEYYASDSNDFLVAADAVTKVESDPDEADFEEGAFGIVVSVHAGVAQQQSFASGKIETGMLPVPSGTGRIFLAESDKLGTWSHEIGHALGTLFTPSETAVPDLYEMGNVGSWDVMATGSRNDQGSHPPQMSSFTKEFLGWLATVPHAKSEYGEHSIDDLAVNGGAVFRFNLEDSVSASSQKYYLLESRSGTISFWESHLLGSGERKLVLYRVNENGYPEYGYDPVTGKPNSQFRKVTIPGNSWLGQFAGIESGILSIGETYRDFYNLVKFTAKNRSSGQGVLADIEPITFADVPRSYVGALADPTDVLAAAAQIIFDPTLRTLFYRDPRTGEMRSTGSPEQAIFLERLFVLELAWGLLFGVFAALGLVPYLRKRVTKDKSVKWTKLATASIVMLMLLLAAIAVHLKIKKDGALWGIPGPKYAPSQIPETTPDLDLHVRCPDGRHVGMNYATGAYEVQIADAITNGDNLGAPEWIFFPPTPENSGCVHSVSAHDNQAFLDANPDLASVLGSATDSYSIYARYIDPASGIFTSSTLEDQIIEPGEVILHAATGTNDIQMLPGVPDLTAPVTTAAASGTLWSDGRTYVSDVTVTLLASDDASGIAKTLYSLDGGVTYVPYPGQILLTQDGERTVTYYSVDGGGNAESPKTLTVTIDHAPLAATVNLAFQRHTVQSGSQPGSTKSPVVSASVKAFSKASGSCASGIGFNPHDYGTILSACAPDHFALTDAAGHVALQVAPGDYLLLARDPETNVVSGVSSGNLALGETADKFLQVIVRANGTSVAGKTTTHTGSLLHVIEPEYIEWNQTEELYPFVFDAPSGDWGVTVTVTPPEGFVADYPALSTDVNNDYKALQFTLTDIGSCWECGTGVDIEIRHQGRTIRQRHTIQTPMTEEFVKRKGLTVEEMEARGVRVKRKKE